MTITREADYALRIVYTLADENIKIDANTLSEKIGVTLRFTLKILRKLLLAGIVRSFKGANGGYMLAKLPSEISMYDVITAIDGDMAVNRCTSDGYQCLRPSVQQGIPCRLNKVFCDLGRKIREYMSEQTFDRLVK